MHKKQNSGVTLVELAIVIVIIGLLITGILSGQTLIKEAKIRSDIVSFDTYRTAIATFLLKYHQLPGDYSKAPDNWHDFTTGGETIPDLEVDGIAGCGFQAGDGNGVWSANEGLIVFNQLALAGLLGGTYPVSFLTTGPTYGPRLKTTNAIVFPFGDFANVGTCSTSPFSSAEFFNWPGAANAFVVSLYDTPQIFPIDTVQPQQKIDFTTVQEIDSKVDDGNGGTGIMRAGYDPVHYPAADQCTDAEGNYRITETGPFICPFVLKL